MKMKMRSGKAARGHLHMLIILSSLLSVLLLTLMTVMLVMQSSMVHAATLSSSSDGKLSSFYSLSLVAHSAEGPRVSMAMFKLHVTLIVNIASNCGFADANYKWMAEMYNKYASKGLEILAFPCGQFGDQEHSDTSGIVKNVRQQYGGSFPIFENVDVNGPNTHPIYAFLKKAFPGDLTWNFGMFIVSHTGEVVVRMEDDGLPVESSMHLRHVEMQLIKYLRKLRAYQMSSPKKNEL